MPRKENIELRPVVDSDLKIFFEQQLDEEANFMAAFTHENPSDRKAFETHWHRIRNDESIVLRSIIFENSVAGYTAHFTRFDKPEVSYWLGKEYWGSNIATKALGQFLKTVEIRPLYARVAKDNLGSIRVLEKNGFTLFKEEKGFAHARGMDLEEYIYKI